MDQTLTAVEEKAELEETPAVEEKAPVKEKLLTGLYLKMMLANLIFMVSSNMQMYILPLYLTQVLGSTLSAAGYMMAVYTVCSLFFRPIWGKLVDRIGRKAILVAGIAIYLTGTVGMRFVPIVLIMFVLRGLQGIGASAESTAGPTVIADVTPQTRRSEGIGYYGISTNLASAMGPLIASGLMASYGHVSVFTFAIVVSVVALAVCLTFNYEKKAKKETGDVVCEAAGPMDSEVACAPKERGIYALFERNALPSATMIALMALPMGFNSTFLPTYAAQAGIMNIKWFFTASAITMIASRAFGRIPDKYSPKALMCPGLVLVFTAAVLVPFVRTLPMIILAGSIMGLGFGLVCPTTMAFIISVCDKNRYGNANATYFAAFDLGIGVGSSIGGFLADTFGFTVTFFIFASFVILSFAQYWFVVRKQVNRARGL